MSDSYVLVSDVLNDTVIAGGPLLWDGVTDFTPPSGTHMLLTVDALADGYTWPVVVESPQDTITQNLINGLGGNDAYLAAESPSSDDLTTQVTALTRYVNGLIRLSTNTLDSTNDC